MAQNFLGSRYFNVARSGDKYGFVDEYQRPILGGYIYDKAEAFGYAWGEYEFAKVHKNGQKYLIDTLGQTYILADTVSEITKHTEAVILPNKKLAEWPEELKKAKKLKILSMPSNQLTAVNRDILKGLKQLEILDLGLNRISVLEPNTFSAQKQLKFLALAGNAVDELEAKVFRGLGRLKILRYPSGAVEVSAENFKYLRRLEYLQILSVDIVKEGAFSGLKRLKNLDIYGADEIEAYAFSGALGLEVLEIGQIDELPVGLLMGLPKLRRFDVYDIEAPLPEDFFIGGERLKELYIGSVVNVEEISFGGLDELEALEIEADDIWVLDTGFFADLPSLKALRLWEPIIKKAGCFRELDKLEYLEIRPAIPDGDEDIGTLPNGVFEGLGELEYLCLYDFDRISGHVFMDVPQLRVLLLEDCGNFFASTFKGIKELEYLFVSTYDFRKGEEEELTGRWPRCRIITEEDMDIYDIYEFPLD